MGRFSICRAIQLYNQFRHFLKHPFFLNRCCWIYFLNSWSQLWTNVLACTKCTEMSTLTHVNLGKCDTRTIHTVWQNLPSQLAVRKATVKALLMVKRYPLATCHTASQKEKKKIARLHLTSICHVVIMQKYLPLTPGLSRPTYQSQLTQAWLTRYRQTHSRLTAEWLIHGRLTHSQLIHALFNL